MSYDQSRAFVKQSHSRTFVSTVVACFCFSQKHSRTSVKINSFKISTLPDSSTELTEADAEMFSKVKRPSCNMDGVFSSSHLPVLFLISKL